MSSHKLYTVYELLSNTKINVALHYEALILHIKQYTCVQNLDIVFEQMYIINTSSKISISF